MSNTFFLCDPDLNVACNKKHCFRNPLIKNPCRSTKHIQFAKKPVEKIMVSIPINKEDAVLFDIKVEDYDGTDNQE